MTQAEILSTANANGYPVDESTLGEAVKDPAFFKAVYGASPVVSVGARHTITCACGRSHTFSNSNERPLWFEKLTTALFSLEAGDVSEVALGKTEANKEVTKDSLETALTEATVTTSAEVSP